MGRLGANKISSVEGWASSFTSQTLEALDNGSEKAFPFHCVGRRKKAFYMH